MKKVICYVLLFIQIIFLYGCSSKDVKNNDINNDENPFNIQGNMNIDYSYGHGVISPDPEKRLLKYTGEDISIKYELDNGEKECSLGIMIFINGIPQPYKTDIDGNYENMKIFKMGINEKKELSLSFKPVVGKKGEILPAHFIVMLNPEVKQNTENFKYFGHDQKISQLLPWRMEFLADANINSQNSNVEYKKVKMNDEFKNKFARKDKDGNESNKLDNNTFLTISVDEKEYNESKLEIEKNSEKLSIDFYGGHSGEYRLMVFLDNKTVPVNKESHYIDVILEKDTIVKVPLSINKEFYKDKSNLYIIAVPIGESNIDNREVLKSGSIIIY